MQGAQNEPPSGGPRHGAAGGLVGYKHGMRDGMRGRGKEKGCGRGRTTAPWERETTGRGDGADDGMRQRGTGQRGVANK